MTPEADPSREREALSSPGVPSEASPNRKRARRPAPRESKYLKVWNHIANPIVAIITLIGLGAGPLPYFISKSEKFEDSTEKLEQQNAEQGNQIRRLESALSSVQRRLDREGGILPVRRILLEPGEERPSLETYDYVSQLRAYVPSPPPDWEFISTTDVEAGKLIGVVSVTFTGSGPAYVWRSKTGIPTGRNNEDGSAEKWHSFILCTRLNKDSLEAAMVAEYDEEMPKNLKRHFRNDFSGAMVAALYEASASEPENNKWFRLLALDKSGRFARAEFAVVIQSEEKKVFAEVEMIILDANEEIVLIMAGPASEKEEAMSKGWINRFLNTVRIAYE